jgi:hypothetical protein
MPKFTYNFPGKRPLLEIYVRTTAARLDELKAEGQSINGPLRQLATALLDTGASMTVLDQSIVDKFKLTRKWTGEMLFYGLAGAKVNRLL